MNREERKRLTAELRAMQQIVISLAPLPPKMQSAVLNVLTVRFFSQTLAEFSREHHE